MKHVSSFEIFDLYLLKNYVDTMEDMLDNKTKEFDLWVEKEYPQLEQTVEAYFMNPFLMDEKWKIASFFPSLFRKSLFISIMSTIQHELNRICYSFEKDYKIKVNDLRGSGIERSRLYLKKVVEVNFPDQHYSWKHISNYKKIRNIIVHKGGKPDQKDISQLQTFLDKSSSIKIDRDMNFVFSANFCKDVLDDTAIFFSELTQAVFKIKKEI